MSDFKKQFGKRVAQLRNGLGLTQNDLAENLDMSESAIVRIETGSAFPKPETIVKIANVLDVDYAELFNFHKELNYHTSKDEIIGMIEHLDKYHPELLPIAKIFLKLLKQK